MAAGKDFGREAGERHPVEGRLAVKEDRVAVAKVSFAGPDTAAVGEPESYERVLIEGEPAIDSRITGGINGDIATCAITLNVVRSVLMANPGLKTMADIPPVAFFRNE